MDEDDTLWHVGRADDVIKTSGYRVGPFEVESALMQHPSVLECAITGVPDDIRGQIIKAFIVLNKGYTAGDALAKDIQAFVKGITAPYKYPRVIEFMDALPKTASGKIKRFELRQAK
ncbi:Acetyl-coenzyme A synthetase [bioreactor metagenome]|uniref:Acetyl-coenzyme A synthetase n=1 Tax=bioreactor metagenome TaxID=1076179 RepID=A0A645JA73_9ZZZZ